MLEKGLVKASKRRLNLGHVKLVEKRYRHPVAQSGAHFGKLTDEPCSIVPTEPSIRLRTQPETPGA
ncbi:hypothetical protein OKW29_008059 [Paraburkholderia sp. CI3]